MSKGEYSRVSQPGVSADADVAITETVPAGQNIERPWHYGLCVLCTEMNSCIESFFCSTCQLSRQYNMFYNLRSEMHMPMCLTVTALEMMGIPAVLALQYVLRADIRYRYGIEGNWARDCCESWCCTSCAVQQQFLELTSLGMCPGMTMCGVTPVVPQENFML